MLRQLANYRAASDLAKVRPLDRSFGGVVARKGRTTRCSPLIERAINDRLSFRSVRFADTRESGLFTMRFSSSSCRSREGGPNRLVDVAKNDLVYRETSRACLDSFSFSAGDQLRIRPTLVCCWGWNERCRDLVPQAWPPRRYYARVATSWNREQTAALKGTDTEVRGRSDPC